jgi:hypothetical protein
MPDRSRLRHRPVKGSLQEWETFYSLNRQLDGETNIRETRQRPRLNMDRQLHTWTTWQGERITGHGLNCRPPAYPCGSAITWIPSSHEQA